jgi:hypothetical protein
MQNFYQFDKQSFVAVLQIVYYFTIVLHPFYSYAFPVHIRFDVTI